ncbi:hypothetical protein [Pontibacter oryzae]|uniref:hypothetical protein n=1 Tax=Pontibacter oryzae TaxID=2304593 RepID=UPI0013157EF8|nr:hypothetical protein [Pontibacter oryzae]
MAVVVAQAQRQLWLCGKHKYKTQAGAAEGAGKSRENGTRMPHDYTLSTGLIRESMRVCVCGKSPGL